MMDFMTRYAPVSWYFGGLLTLLALSIVYWLWTHLRLCMVTTASERKALREMGRPWEGIRCDASVRPIICKGNTVLNDGPGYTFTANTCHTPLTPSD